MSVKDKWAIDLCYKPKEHVWKEIDRFWDKYPDMTVIVYECQTCCTFIQIFRNSVFAFDICHKSIDEIKNCEEYLIKKLLE